MRPISTLVWGLFTINLASLPSTINAAETCTTEPYTLSSTCGGICSSIQTCLTYNASDATTCTECMTDAAESCSYFCFNTTNLDTTGAYAMIFLIPFGSYTSPQEIYQRAVNPNFDSAISSLPDKTNLYAWANNDILTRIDPLDVSEGTTQVVLAGGTDWAYVVKSKVVDVQLEEGLLASAPTSVATVSLVSINLQEEVDKLPSRLPSSVATLDLSNTLLQSFPTSLATVTSLETLYLHYNYITSVSSTDSLDSLKYLGIEYNEMTRFEAYYPNLEMLDLIGNNFTEIPTAVFEHKNLQALYMDKNALISPKFTTSQANFLMGLTTLDLTTTSFQLSLDCDLSTQVTIHSLTVCVTDFSSDNPVGGNSSSGSSTTENGSSSNTAMIIGIIVGVVVLVLGIVIACLCYRRKRNQDKLTATTTGQNPGYLTANTTNTNTSKNGEVGSLWQDADLLQLQVRNEDIQDIKKLGNGAYGVVWLVRYRESQLLASKRLQKDQVTRQRTQGFVEEIKLVSKLDHPNIVRFIGAAWNIETDLQALFEYMENGDLREYLADPTTRRSWDRTKLQFAVDIIEALVYVHSFNPPLVHRDLKSRNVLITRDWRAKLTDFGVSRFRSQDNTMTSGVGTSRWLAPEVIMGSTDYGAPADIYSFGVVLSELDTHNVPYGDSRNASGTPLADVAILQMVIAGTLRPTFNSSCPHDILRLADRCLAHNPTDRPTAPELAYALRNIMKSLF